MHSVSILHLRECWHGCWLPLMSLWLLCQLLGLLAVRLHLLACSVLEQMLPGCWCFETQTVSCAHIVSCSTTEDGATCHMVFCIQAEKRSSKLSFHWIHRVDFLSILDARKAVFVRLFAASRSIVIPHSKDYHRNQLSRSCLSKILPGFSQELRMWPYFSCSLLSLAACGFQNWL